jgi:hypothetical protein
MKKLILAALVAASLSAQADTMGVHVATWHEKPGFNNVNPGLYYRTASGFQIGGYYNSNERLSLYAAQVWQWGWFSITAGVVTGYEKPIMPLILPSVRVLHTKDFDLNLSFIPQVTPKGSAAIHLSISKEF